MPNDRIIDGYVQVSFQLSGVLRDTATEICTKYGIEKRKYYNDAINSYNTIMGNTSPAITDKGQSKIEELVVDLKNVREHLDDTIIIIRKLEEYKAIQGELIEKLTEKLEIKSEDRKKYIEDTLEELHWGEL